MSKPGNPDVAWTSFATPSRHVQNALPRAAAVLAVAAALVVTPVSAQVTVEAELATEIVEMMPQGTATSFPADVGTVYLWTRITGAADSSVRHVWVHDGMEFPVDLEMGGSPWRTWSSKAIPPEWSGDWSVEIRDASGAVLETVGFTVGS